MAQNKTKHYLRTNDVSNGIIILDDELHIYHYNKWLELHTNLKEKDILQKKIDTIFSNIKRKTLQRKIRTALTMGTPTFYTAATSEYFIPIKISQIKNARFKYMQQDVSILPYDINKKQVTLIITDQTNMVNTQALLQENIQKVKQLNQELIKEKEIVAKKNEELIYASRNAAMGEMIAMIAHQWKQPLSVVNTSIANLKIKRDLETLQVKDLESSFENIEKTIFYLSDTINDFKDYFKPNKKKTLTNISQLVNKSLYFLKMEMSNIGIKYQQEIPENLEIYTYKNELLQSLINVIKNSLDAFKKNSSTNKYININVISNKKYICLNIEDNAGGIKTEIIDHVFEPYFSTKGKNGTGLGLYMCYTIIKEHLDGDIRIFSQDVNTLVKITLPIQKEIK